MLFLLDYFLEDIIKLELSLAREQQLLELSLEQVVLKTKVFFKVEPRQII